MRLRQSKRIAAGVTLATLAAAAALGLAVKVGHAVAQASSDNDSRTAALRATPENFGGDEAVATNRDVKAEDDAALLAAAVKPGPRPHDVRWSESDRDSMSGWVEPGLRRAERFAGRYEPRFDFRIVQRDGESQAQLQVSLGRSQSQPQSVQRAVMTRLGLNTAPPPALKRKGHWFLYAAGGTNAVGLNLLRDPSGELKRAGWTYEHIAATDSGQVGIGWRKGPLQASLGLVQRQLSTYGQSVREQFIAFTLSISPEGVKAVNPNRTWLETGDDRYQSRRR